MNTRLFLLALVLSGTILSQRPTARQLGPGDEGYMHEQLHGDYQAFFKGRCPCSIGECRPTIVRSSTASESGMDVLIDGKWYPVPPGVLTLRKGITDELLTFPAHVCARTFYRDGVLTPIIECLVYNGAT